MAPGKHYYNPRIENKRYTTYPITPSGRKKLCLSVCVSVRTITRERIEKRLGIFRVIWCHKKTDQVRE